MATERAELAKLCSSRNWSKAIRILDKLLAKSCSIQDICNRAFCYSQLELHKHVVKDCDKALQLDPNLLRAYILKGNALSALGRKEEALLIWEKGYEIAVEESTDLKQLLELEELLSSAKLSQQQCSITEDTSVDTPPCDTKVVISEDRVVDTKTVICEDHTTDSSSSDGPTSPTESKTKEANGGSSEEGETGEKKEVSLSINTNKKMVEFCKNPNGGETIKLDRKLFVTNYSSKTKSISLDLRLSRGIAQVNEGNYNQAISIFDQILRETPTYPEALIGRGTAYAFQRELDSAIADFTKAIQSNPSAAEAWKRRGQARAALGEFSEAIEDLSKALQYEPNSPDVLHERGIVNFKFKDYNSAVEDLTACVKCDKKNSSAHTYLGLSLAAVGEHQKAETEHLLAIKLDQNFLDSWAHLAQLYLDLANSEKALQYLDNVLVIDGRFAKAYHLRGLLYHGMGQHRTAIKDLSVALTIEGLNIECLYLRASCYHAIGEYKSAAKDYDAVLDLELDSVDKFVLQCLAFYQKEIALYTASKVNFEFSQFNIDDDIDPLFKEYWCKRLHPKYVCEKVYRQPPLRISLKGGRLNKQEFKFTKHQISLLQAADHIGKRIQYNCPGFLHNRRQYRMVGLAAIEIAQKVSKHWRVLRNAKKNGKPIKKKDKLGLASLNRGGSGCSTSGPSAGTTTYSSIEERGVSVHSLPWQDIYSLAVKWRQISEPCDPVVWVNKLSEEFNSGFGSHTPMLLGQAKVVRYYPNYQRTLDTAKTIILNTKYVTNAEDRLVDLSGKLDKIKSASSCFDLYNLVGENFWVSTTCDSMAYEGKKLEGTRITTQMTDRIGFDFAIRTPCTPSRWEEYDEEIAFAWEALCVAYSGDLFASHDLNMLNIVKDAILRMTYYWYNFMPLSRGSAAVGYTVMLGLFLAANMEVTTSIPPGVQVDWEAILSPNPETFIESVKQWMYPSIKINRSWKDHADVSMVFNTTGSVVAALSSYDN
ncbi:Tetratricopeptide repeat protein 13 [Rhynchospora pubera]|uniref:Tetratricopeptide repeat protein 13 n=1 Tax=Rhynchospora pubera TaxID=906938 RepID=A0AAV8CVJ6_9POAL|nr:Tetratricopeptide repeat protein 13 [Rhynchospora pubera]